MHRVMLLHFHPISTSVLTCRGRNAVIYPPCKLQGNKVLHSVKDSGYSNEELPFGQEACCLW